MDFLKDFFRKYSSLILPVGIALAAMALLVPTFVISGSIKQKVKSSIKTNSRVESLTRSAVSERQWLLEKEYQDLIAADANEIVNLAIQTSMRPLLSYNIFPEPKVASNQIFNIFGDKYVEAIEKLASDVMNSGDAPSQAVLNNLTSRTGGSTRGNIGRTTNEQDPAQRIIDTACLEKARQISVYANPQTSFVGYDFWKDYVFVNKNTAVEDCWYSQLAYWIQEDITQTIAALNDGSSSVLTSKVKRLLGISFSKSVVEAASVDSSRRTTTDGSFDKPSYILADEQFGLAPVWTGRTSNDEIDVVHFAFAVIIDVKAEPQFYEQLCSGKKHIFKGWEDANEPAEFVRNQITVLEHSLSPIEAESADHQYFRYGSGGVAKLNLVCEYIFNRKGYDAVKPQSVKDYLSQLQEQGR